MMPTTSHPKSFNQNQLVTLELIPSTSWVTSISNFLTTPPIPSITWTKLKLDQLVIVVWVSRKNLHDSRFNTDR
jgi:hypothetical protein